MPASSNRKTDHQYDSNSAHFMNALTLEGSHTPGKPRHVEYREVYEVSLAMLRFGKGAWEVSDQKFDTRSLGELRGKATGAKGRLR